MHHPRSLVHTTMTWSVISNDLSTEHRHVADGCSMFHGSHPEGVDCDPRRCGEWSSRMWRVHHRWITFVHRVHGQCTSMITSHTPGSPSSERRPFLVGDRDHPREKVDSPSMVIFRTHLFIPTNVGDPCENRPRALREGRRRTPECQTLDRHPTQTAWERGRH